MKYINSLVFLSLMVLVAGCQKKGQQQVKKGNAQVAAKQVKAKKQGPTKLETKKSAANNKNKKQQAAPAKQGAKQKDNDKKVAAPKKEKKNAKA